MDLEVDNLLKLVKNQGGINNFYTYTIDKLIEKIDKDCKAFLKQLDRSKESQSTADLLKAFRESVVKLTFMRSDAAIIRGLFIYIWNNGLLSGKINDLNRFLQDFFARIKEAGDETFEPEFYYERVRKLEYFRENSMHAERKPIIQELQKKFRDQLLELPGDMWTKCVYWSDYESLWRITDKLLEIQQTMRDKRIFDIHGGYPWLNDLKKYVSQFEETNDCEKTKEWELQAIADGCYLHRYFHPVFSKDAITESIIKKCPKCNGKWKRTTHDNIAYISNWCPNCRKLGHRLCDCRKLLCYKCKQFGHQAKGWHDCSNDFISLETWEEKHRNHEHKKCPFSDHRASERRMIVRYEKYLRPTQRKNESKTSLAASSSGVSSASPSPNTSPSNASLTDPPGIPVTPSSSGHSPASRPYIPGLPAAMVDAASRKKRKQKRKSKKKTSDLQDEDEDTLTSVQHGQGPAQANRSQPQTHPTRSGVQVPLHTHHAQPVVQGPQQAHTAQSAAQPAPQAGQAQQVVPPQAYPAHGTRLFYCDRFDLTAGMHVNVYMKDKSFTMAEALDIDYSSPGTVLFRNLDTGAVFSVSLQDLAVHWEEGGNPFRPPDLYPSHGTQLFSNKRIVLTAGMNVLVLRNRRYVMAQTLDIEFSIVLFRELGTDQVFSVPLKDLCKYWEDWGNYINPEEQLFARARP